MKPHFTPIYHDHLRSLKIHPVQTDEYEAMLSSASYEAFATCTGVTCWLGERVLGMAGLFQIWPGRAEAWVLVSEEMRKHTLQVFPKIKYVLDSVPFRRIEMTVKAHNKHGHKLAKHLGFEKEGVLRNYWPGKDGPVDVVLYSRIK